MKNYVKSRGISKGHSWLDQNQKEISNPPILNSVIQMVDSDDFLWFFIVPMVSYLYWLQD